MQRSALSESSSIAACSAFVQILVFINKNVSVFRTLGRDGIRTQVFIKPRNHLSDKHRFMKREPLHKIAGKRDVLSRLSKTGVVMLEARPGRFVRSDFPPNFAETTVHAKVGFEGLHLKVVKWTRSSSSGGQDMISHKSSQRQAM